jgi:hypothetical protein
MLDPSVSIKATPDGTRVWVRVGVGPIKNTRRFVSLKRKLKQEAHTKRRRKEKQNKTKDVQ